MVSEHHPNVNNTEQVRCSLQCRCPLPAATSGPLPTSGAHCGRPLSLGMKQLGVLSALHARSSASALSAARLLTLGSATLLG